MTELPITLRPAQPNDYGYVLASWSRELHKVSPYNYIPNSIFFPWVTDIINTFLRRSDCLVACIDDSPDDIVGYLVCRQHDADNLIVGWCQVKAIYRRLGVAKTLLSTYQHQRKNLVCPFFFKLFRPLRERYHLILDPTLLGTYE